MTETRVTDPNTGGQKGTKPERYDLIPPGFLYPAIFPKAGTNPRDVAAISAINNLDNFRLERVSAYLENAFGYLFEALAHDGVHAGDELARVYEFGSRKYEPWNWLRGYAWSLSFAACCRHVSLWARGERLDPETGCHHLAHASWHIVTLLTFVRRALGTDDLYTAELVVPASEMSVWPGDCGAV